jgi:hypothetical protein
MEYEAGAEDLVSDGDAQDAVSDGDSESKKSDTVIGHPRSRNAQDLEGMEDPGTAGRAGRRRCSASILFVGGGAVSTAITSRRDLQIN